MTYTKIDAIIIIAQANHRMSLRFAPRYVRRISLFLYLKEKGGRRPPPKISLCLGLYFDFHCYYHSKAIEQLIAKLAHMMSYKISPPFQKGLSLCKDLYILL